MSNEHLFVYKNSCKSAFQLLLVREASSTVSNLEPFNLPSRSNQSLVAFQVISQIQPLFCSNRGLQSTWRRPRPRIFFLQLHPKRAVFSLYLSLAHTHYEVWCVYIAKHKLRGEVRWAVPKKEYSGDGVCCAEMEAQRQSVITRFEQSPFLRPSQPSSQYRRVNSTIAMASAKLATFASSHQESWARFYTYLPR